MLVLRNYQLAAGPVEADRSRRPGGLGRCRGPASSGRNSSVRIKTRATIGADDPGVPAASPYINIINQQAKIMLKAASELGFTPVSRPRINAGVGPDFSVGQFATERGIEDEDLPSFDEYLAAAPKAVCDKLR